MFLSEADTRTKLIDPALHTCGWTLRGFDAPRGDCWRGGDRGRVDYILRVKVTSETQPVAVDLIEAKGKEAAETRQNLEIDV